MPRRFQRHTRVVAVAKIALPLIGVGLMATMFLVTGEVDFQGGLQLSDVTLDLAHEGMQITNPELVGANLDGDRFRVEAEQVFPDSPLMETVIAERVQAEIAFATGQSAEITAGAATINTVERKVSFADGARMTTSDGYAFDVTSLDIDLDAGTVRSDDPSQAEGPPGEISAGRLDMVTLSGEDGENRMIWLSDGVKVRLNIARGTEEAQ